MGWIFGLLGAFGGSWIASENRTLFGFLVGFLIGWLLHRALDGQATIRRLGKRIDALEQQSAKHDVVETIVEEKEVEEKEVEKKVVEKKIAMPERVSIYEPQPIEEVAPAVQPQATAAETVEAESIDFRARTPVADAKPSMGAHAIDVAKRWLTTGNVPVKVGVIISFFGVAFLLKYAIENEVFVIPIGVRYLGIAIFATALLVFGWRKRDENRVFALSIQGGGVGVLFLTVFAAFRLHDLLHPAIAFGLLILITATAGILAIKQESRAFAILGTSGGFLAPILVSTGSGNHVGLFSYYLILNCAVLGVAWYRPWRELNIIGFVFTFGVGTLWGYQYYVPELFSTTEPFLVLYFLFYTIIAVLFAFRQRPELRGYVDGTLLFGTPTIAFALQSQLLSDTEYGLAISAAVVALFYASMAYWLRQKQDRDFGLLVQAFIALAVAFGTIAIPLALDDRWTAIAWALEGSALVWIGVRQATTLAKMSGAALAFAAGAEFLSYGWIDGLGIPVLNGNFVGGTLISLSSLYSSYMLLTDERGREWQKFISASLLGWGLFWWFGTAYSEISDRAPYSVELLIAVVMYAASFSAMLYAANRLQWSVLWQITLGILPLAGGSALIGYGWSENLGAPVLNGNVLGGALIAWMSLYAARKFATDERSSEVPGAIPLSFALLAWGLLFWFGTGTLEVMDRVSSTNRLHALLLFGSMSFAAIALAGLHFGWLAYRRISLALLPTLFIAGLVYVAEHDHFFAGFGVLAWVVAFLAHVWILYCFDRDKLTWVSIWHTTGAVFFVTLIAYESYWQVARFVTNDVWSISVGLLILAASAVLLLMQRRSQRWPFLGYMSAYLSAALLLIVSYIVLVIRVSISDPGDPAPFPYVPILNPFDILTIVALASIWVFMKLDELKNRLGLSDGSSTLSLFFYGTAFLLSTISVVRIVHHMAGVEWTSSVLMNSVAVQSTLSIYWAVLGLSGMVLGTRRANRGVWMFGAALMSVVVLKLFVIDLGNTGTVARIISFLGVGVMLLVVGYFSPVPPKPQITDGE